MTVPRESTSEPPKQPAAPEGAADESPTPSPEDVGEPQQRSSDPPAAPPGIDASANFSRRRGRRSLKLAAILGSLIAAAAICLIVALSLFNPGLSPLRTDWDQPPLPQFGIASDGSRVATLWNDLGKRFGTYMTASYVEVRDTNSGSRVLQRSSIDKYSLRERGPPENHWYWDEIVFSSDLKRVACLWRGREFSFAIVPLERLPMALPGPSSSDGYEVSAKVPRSLNNNGSTGFLGQQ